jgi:hypothetical protein
MKKLIKDLLDIKSELPASPFPIPLFIGGIMRSGTTLLLDMLTEHPQLLKIGRELNFAWTEVGGANCGAWGLKNSCDHLTEADFNPRFVQNMTYYFANSINYEKRLVKTMMRYRRKKQKGSGGVTKDWDQIIPVNKSPHITNKLRYVHALFPDSKIILIIRGIHGQVNSQRRMYDKALVELGIDSYLPPDSKNCWQHVTPDEVTPEMRGRLGSDNFSLFPEAWIRLNYDALKDIQHIPKEKVFVTTYEDVATIPQEIVGKVFDFLELDPEQKHLEKEIAGKKRKVFNTLSKGNPLNSWQEELSQEEKDAIDKVIKDHQDEYDFIQEEIARYKAAN